MNEVIDDNNESHLWVLAVAVICFLLGSFLTMQLTDPQWVVAVNHCRADGYSSGWYDAEAKRIRCVTITEAK